MPDRPLDHALDRLSPTLRRSLTGVLVLTAVLAVAIQLKSIWDSSVGVDFIPLRAAATSLLHGRSIYSNHDFVYPPTAVLPLLPTALGSPLVAYRLWCAVGIAGLVLTSWAIAALASSRHRYLVAGALTMVLVAGEVANSSLWLGNLSVLLAPAAVLTVVQFERGRWAVGCGLLVTTLMIKPLLLPLLLIPMLHGRWRDLIRAALPAAVVTGIAIITLPGASDIGAVARYVAGGTNLRGGGAVNNLSLRGWGETTQHTVGAAAAAAVVGLIGLGGLFWLRRSTLSTLGSNALGTDRTGATRFAILAQTTVLLAGTISECHFLLTIVSLVLLEVALRPSVRSLILALPGLAFMVVPSGLVFAAILPGARGHQLRFVLAELFVLGFVLGLPALGSRSLHNLGPSYWRRQLRPARRRVDDSLATS